MRKFIKELEPIPNWYGVAYYDHGYDSHICYPIPFHVFAKFYYQLKWRFKILSKKSSAELAYRLGFYEGFIKGQNK